MTNRRSFLKYSILALGGLGLRMLPQRWGDGVRAQDHIVRICVHKLGVFPQPSETGEPLFYRKRDELVNVYEEVISPDGPEHNPRWYRVWGGYLYSARTQKVNTTLNPIVEDIHKGGHLAEVTVPMTQSMRWISVRKRWEPVYRLYYESHHWVTGIEPGPDGLPWYRIHDELTEINYLVEAAHLRLLSPEAFDPLSTQVDPAKKRIHVSIGKQMLTAFEGDQVVLETRVSTGVGNWRDLPGKYGTETPLGDHYVLSKMPSKHMGVGGVTADIEAYELVGVPWTTFFTTSGVAIHGTFWHQNYGTPMSKGCVNVPTEIAKWIFRWTTPVCSAQTWEQRGRGTLVEVTG